ncbi:MAG: hypothetical protein AB2L11_06715 [Syntrophobacteraceae bacterium]
MEYGLRRYEAVQRLLWFLSFLLCMFFAYPFAKSYRSSPVAGAITNSGPEAEVFKSSAFWTSLDWLQGDSLLTFAIVYLVWIAILFLAGKIIWLLTQHVGKNFAKSLLTTHIRKQSTLAGQPSNSLSPNFNRLFPTDLLLRKVSIFPASFLFHSYQRLRLMLGGARETPASEELMERERRVVETDWQILVSTWTPFRWIIWCLPVLGLLETSRLLHHHLQPLIAGQRELLDIFGPLAGSFVPVVQTITATIVFTLISGLQKRLETLYLSGVDALFYDQFLSKLPFQSGDTVILLEAIQRQFQDLHNVLRRIERSIGVTVGEKKPAVKES